MFQTINMCIKIIKHTISNNLNVVKDKKKIKVKNQKLVLTYISLIIIQNVISKTFILNLIHVI